MSIACIIRLGGHIFYSVADCARFFGVPELYVAHMVVSEDYPGCVMEFVVTSDIGLMHYFQTLSVMKADDVDPNSKP